MYEVNCLDKNGNTINSFFQWDVDQEVTVKLEGFPQNYLSIAPEFHFANNHRDTALIVRSEVTREDTTDTVTAPVPNILLQEAHPLLVYVYLTDSEDVSSQKTILYSQIPIRKRSKPSDYQYIENITRITAEDIKSEIEASTKETRDSAITTITNEKNGFITTGNGLVTTANGLLADVQKKHDEAVKTASSTKTVLENDINTKMKTNGLNLKTVNDGQGNVNLAVVLKQS